MKIIELWKKFWKATAPDPYFHIACDMELMGYTELEIELEIAALKKANGDE